MKRIVLLFVLLTSLFMSGVSAQNNSTEDNILSAMLSLSFPYDSIMSQVENYVDTASNPSRHFGKNYGRWTKFWNSRIDGNGGYQSYFDVMGQITAPGNQAGSGAIPSSTDSYCETGGEWVLGGPFVDDQWAGRIESVYAEPSLDVVYAGSHAGGLWKTENGGNTWRCLTDGIRVPYLGITDIIGHPDPNIETIYVATGSKHNWGIGVLKSTDGGDTFTFPTGISWSPVWGEAIHDLEMDPNNPDVIYASGSEKIYKTVDGGDNWTPVLDHLQYTPPLSSDPSITCTNTFNAYEFRKTVVLPGNSNIVFTAMYNIANENSDCNNLPIIQVSQDGGDSWQELSLPLYGNPGVKRCFIAVSAAEPLDLFVIYDDGGFPSSEKALYKFNYTPSCIVDTTPCWTLLKRLDFAGSPANNKGPDNNFAPFEVNDVDADIIYFGGTQTTKITNALTPTPNQVQTLGTITNYSGINHADIRAIHLLTSMSEGIGDQLVIGTDGGISIATGIDGSGNLQVTDGNDDWININNTDGVLSSLSEELCIAEFFLYGRPLR